MMVLYLYIAVSTRLRRQYPELRCQPRRPSLAIASRCLSRCVAGPSLETAVDRGGMKTAASGCRCASARHRADRTLDLVEQIRNRRDIADIVRGQFHGGYLVCIGVDRQMKFRI